MLNSQPENNRRSKGWSEFHTLANLMGRGTGENVPFADGSFVELISDAPAKKEEIKNTSTEEKEKGAEDLLVTSRGHIEVITKQEDTTSPRETVTTGARKALIEDINGAQIEVLPEEGVHNADNPAISLEEKQMFETVLEQGASNEREERPTEKNPIDAAMQEIGDKLRASASALHHEIRNLDQKQVRKLEEGVIDLSQRITEMKEMREKISDDELLNKLHALSEEVAMVGSKEWKERFIEKEKPEAQTHPSEETRDLATISGAIYKTIEDLRLPIGRLLVPEKKELEDEFHALGERMMKLINADTGDAVSRENILRLEQDAETLKQKVTDYADKEIVFAPETQENLPAAPKNEEEKEGQISAEIEAQFQKDFGMAQEDLKNIATKIETPEGEKTIRFSDLTTGQQLLLLENLKDFALDNAKEQALKHFTEEEKEKYGKAGFIKKAFLSYTKSYRRAADIAQTEKDMLEKPELDRGTYTEVLREMLGAASEAPEAEWKDGKLQINFISEKDLRDTPDAKEKVKEYNDIVTQFVSVPYEWAYSKNEKEQKQYQEAKESYAKVRTELGWLAYEQEEEGGDALSFVASLDKKIQFGQLFNTHPDVEKVFAETKDQKAWVEGLKAIVKEKGTLMALGRTLSTVGAGVAVSVGSGFAAPLAVALAGGFTGGALSGGIIGRYMARKRTGQEIEDKKKLAEMGVVDASNEKEFRAAHEEKEGIEIGIGLADKLEYAVERVLGAETEEEKGQLLKVLADRMHYTEKKLSMEVVNFGDGAEGFRGRYELLSALTKAQTLFAMSEPETNEKVEKKIDELLGTQEERIETAEEKLKSEKMRQGMKYGIILGGTFGTLLSSISYTHAHGGTVAEAQPTTPAPNADNALLETVAPHTSAIPKDTLADDILSKLKFAKNYELPADNTTQNIQNTDTLSAGIIPKTEVSVSQVEATKTALEEVYRKLGIDNPKILGQIQNLDETYKNLTDKQLSHVETEMPSVPQTVTEENINHGGTFIPDAVKVPESVLPQPKMGFSSLQEGTVVSEAVKIPENFFQAPAEHLAPNTAGHEETFIPKDGWEFGTKEVSLTPGVIETLTPRQTAIEQSLLELGKTHMVIKGDTLWSITKSELGGNDYWKQLGTTAEGVRQQNFILDTLRHALLSRPKEDLIAMGIKSGDINRIYPGDRIDLSRVFDKEGLTRIFNRAEHLQTLSHSPTADAEIAHYTTATPTEIVHHATPASEVITRSHQEPIILAQNEGVAMTDVTAPLQPKFPAHAPEFVAPTTTGGNFEAFTARIQDIPVYMNYKSLVYNEIHLRHPEIGLPTYDMKLKDFLVNNPQGLEELKRIFYMKGVDMPKKIPNETLNGSVLDWWTRQVVQHDLNNGLLAPHTTTPMEQVQQTLPERENIYQNEVGVTENINAFTVPREQIPQQYYEQAQRGIAQQYPDMSEEARRQMLDVAARELWWKMQSSGLPPGTPNPYVIFDTARRVMAPRDQTDLNIGVDDIAYRMRKTIDDITTKASIHRSMR